MKLQRTDFMIELYIKVKASLGKYISRPGFKISLPLTCCATMGKITNITVLMSTI